MTVLDVTGFAQGQRVRLPGRADILVIQDVVTAGDGCTLYVAPEAAPDDITRVPLAAGEAAGVEVLRADGRADPRQVLAGLWNEWMRHSVASAKATALASTPLRAYPHQTLAVYGSMLPQPVLRFLLADEPGTGSRERPGCAGWSDRCHTWRLRCAHGFFSLHHNTVTVNWPRVERRQPDRVHGRQP